MRICPLAVREDGTLVNAENEQIPGHCAAIRCRTPNIHDHLDGGLPGNGAQIVLFGP
jgi:hypothetical protein